MIDFSLPDTMLGKQAEGLFEMAIHASESFEIKAANLQVQGISETIGELDYILKHKATNRFIHVELACKFYLFDKNIEGETTAKWVGPNRKDTLADKLHKLRKKQFPLLQTSETKEILRELELTASEVQQQVCIKAQLFIPKHISKNDLPANYHNCIVGQWIRYPDFLSEDTKATYYIPSKREWLLPVEEITEWHSFVNTTSPVLELLNKKRSPLVYKKTGTSIERFFVVWW
ncbi:DUF1853 family protein [Jejudonia soesokkakensis]|uniref:DUF1853 family protein n=1 Tax=Jejudonia soesokkakensis TaxID=1323432 RepID=A0ABW2MX30_9FLAO